MSKAKGSKRTKTIRNPRAPADSDLSGAREPVDAVRRFNRFYTRRIGVLEEGLLHSTFTLTEARVIYELAHREQFTATDVVQELGLNAGYLSRIMRALHERGVIRKSTSKTDARQEHLSLTKSGERAFARLNADSAAAIQTMIDGLPPDDVPRLIAAMQTIERMLGTTLPLAIPYLLRAHQPGDIGWVIHRQAVLYAQEYGWNEEYEALIARILADFVDHFDPKRERCWIAEREGDIVGSVFLVKHPERDGVAKLRLLYVEPAARGLGIGRRLVQEVTRFARQAGYHTLTLWTNSVLVAARRLYAAEGYRLIAEEPHRSFGKNLVGQTWELAL